MQANKSAYRQIKTCATCKNWDVGPLTLCGKFKTSSLAAKCMLCMFEGHAHWEPEQEKPYNYFIKDCTSCKYDHEGWCNKFQRYCAIASGPKCLGGSGDCISHRYWEPKQEHKKEMLKLTPIPDGTFHQTANEAGMLIKKSDNVFIVDYGEDIDNYPKKMMTLKRVYKVDETGSWSAVGNAPEKKRLELSDLYSIAFPFDPIQEHFAGIYKQIEAEYQKKKEILDRVKVKPVEHVEPVEAPEKPKEKSEALKDWAWLEKIIVVVVAVAYAIIVVCCILDGVRIFEVTVIFALAFLGLSIVNTILVFFEGRQST